MNFSGLYVMACTTQTGILVSREEVHIAGSQRVQRPKQQAQGIFLVCRFQLRFAGREVREMFNNMTDNEFK